MDKIASSQDIEKIIYNILKDSKSLNILPTQVDKIVQYSDLKVNTGIDLSEVHPKFVTKQIELIKRIIKKVRGALDFRKKEIYLDFDQTPERINFVKLHETAHKVLPWHNEIFTFADDDYNLSHKVKEELEREANYFASSTFFQLDRFNEEAIKLPLELPSAIHLAKLFGSSIHAALRRYVEFSNKRCALLVLEATNYKFKLRDYFESSKFLKDVGHITWPEYFGPEYPFIIDITSNRRIHTNGTLNLIFNNKVEMTLLYHYFNNSYNYFIFLLPKGEKNKSRSIIHY